LLFNKITLLIRNSINDFLIIAISASKFTQKGLFSIFFQTFL